MTPVGLDLSLTSTGWAFGDEVGRVRSPRTGPARLVHIRDAVMALVRDVIAPVVFVEGPSFNAKHNRAVSLGELHGVVKVALLEAGVPFVVVPPATLKKFATGKGNASKDMMLVAAVKRLDYEGASNDEADALWLRALGAQVLGDPVVAMPKTHLAALDKLHPAQLDPVYVSNL